MRIFGIVGWKNSGKTGLIERLLVEITGQGFTVSTIKHAHHMFDIDQLGKDSYRHRQAGATEVLLSSRHRFALMHELRHEDEPQLDALVKKLSLVDLVLVEGYKDHAYAKIEAHREVTGHSLMALNDRSICAIASDTDISLDRPVFDLDNTYLIANFILKEVGLIKFDTSNMVDRNARSNRQQRDKSLNKFDTIVMIDWSAANDQGLKPKKNAIWAAVAREKKVKDKPKYFRNRQVVECWLEELIEAEINRKQRLCIGFDFPFGYPTGFARALTGSKDITELWKWFANKVTDSPKKNNRFEVAGEINRKTGNGKGPFWGVLPSSKTVEGLSKSKENYANPFPERRKVEQLVPSASTCWKLAYVGSVGSQSIMGFPTLHRLRERFQEHVAIWPFDDINDKLVVFAEIYPSYIVKEPEPNNCIIDKWQVLKCAEYFASLSGDEWSEFLDFTHLEPGLRDIIREEGWILGVKGVREEG